MKPQCKVHGNSMVAERSSRQVSAWGTRRGRTIYRCKEKGCHFVSCGPADSYHTVNECNLKLVKPW